MNFYNYNFEEFQNFIVENKFPKFRAKQVFDWVYTKRVFDVEQMLNIPKNLREFLKENVNFMPLEQVVVQNSKDGTRKFLFGLEDKELIETVLMPQHYGYSICVTTQVGCNIGCSFCASGIRKKVRDLTSGEILAQVVAVQKAIDNEDKRIRSIVVMGIGEPLDNYDNLLKFYKNVNSPHTLNIGSRHITISTSGIVSKFDDFARDFAQCELAISLHAPNDEVRSKLMKINKVYNLEELFKAIKSYQRKTNYNRITFEYIMIENINDTNQHAVELANLIKQYQVTNYHLNLIPYNPVKEVDYKRSPRKNIEDFENTLASLNVSVTRRAERGKDIEAACGQLRSKNQEI